MKWILKWNSIFSVWCPKNCVAYRLFSKFRWRDTSSAAENVKISYNLAIGRKRQLYARRCKIYFRIRIYLGVYFFDHRFIRGRPLFSLKFFCGDTGRATFWSPSLYGADNFLVWNFTEMIQGWKLFASSFYTGQTTFVYGAGKFLDPHIIRGEELFFDRKIKFSGPVFPQLLDTP